MNLGNLDSCDLEPINLYFTSISSPVVFDEQFRSRPMSSYCRSGSAELEVAHQATKQGVDRGKNKTQGSRIKFKALVPNSQKYH